MLNKFNPRKTKYLRIVNILLKLFFHEKKAVKKPDISNAHSILIIDPTLIGDIVMLTPFLRIIRKNNKNCIITLACGKWAVDLLKDQNLVDNFIIIDSSFLNSIKNLAFNRKKLKELVSRVNVREYDYALEPRGDIRYIYFMHFCNAKRKISYNYSGGECFLTDIIIPNNSIEHLIDDKLNMLRAIGCTYTEQDRIPSLKRTEDYLLFENDYKNVHSLSGKIVIGIHPGSSLNIKKWEHYDKLIQKLSTQIENSCFIVFAGPGETEADFIANFAKNCTVCKTDLKKYIYTLALCDCVICNDSGAGHIATALSVQTVTLLGPFPASFCAPVGSTSHPISKIVHCKPCLLRECKYGTKECLEQITVDEVFETVMECIRKIKKAS